MKPIRYIKFEPTKEERIDKLYRSCLYFLAGLLVGSLLSTFYFGYAHGQTVSPNKACSPASEQRTLYETPFVRAVIASESSFNPLARSKAGARGLMQLIPSTASYVHRALFGFPLPKDKLTDPYVNVALGTTYLLEMIYKFRDIDLALAAYNGGPGAVKRGFRARQYVNKINQLAQK